MQRISLRRLLSKLTILALQASPAVATAATSPISQAADCDDDDDLDSDATIDREHLDPDVAVYVLARNLALALPTMKPLDATHLATTWALSSDPLRRAAIAKSLEYPFPLLGGPSLIDHLSRDAEPMIRAACARAARARGRHAILDRLATDPDPEVRAIAQGN